MSQLDFLIWLERLRSGPTNLIFEGATGLGAEEGYMAVLTFIYICVGHRFGIQVLVMFLVSAYANVKLKMGFDALYEDNRRPFERYPELVHPLRAEGAGGGSFPSGHSQNAAAVWGMMALRQTSWRLRAACLLVIGLIAFSRLYCQVHWPMDVMGGLAIGAFLVIAYLAIIGTWRAGRLRMRPGHWAVAVVVIATVMYLFGRHQPDCVGSAGTLLGAGLGYLLLEGRGYKAAAPFLTQALKFVTALAVLLALKLGGKSLLGESAPSWAMALQYAAMGFTVAYLLPVFFTEFHEWRSRTGGRQEPGAPPSESPAGPPSA